MTKEQYDNEDFRSINKRIADHAISIIKEYISNGYEVLGIIGINESPTCSINGNKGIVMEELIHILNKENIKINYLDVPTNYHYGEGSQKFISDLRELLKQA